VDVKAARLDLVQIFDGLPATLDRPTEMAEEHVENLDSAIP
jgi:hypothetical protein